MLAAGPLVGREGGDMCGTSGQVCVLHLCFWAASMLWGSCRLGDGRMRFPRGVLQLSFYCLSVLCLCCALFTLLFTRASIIRAHLSPELCLC